MTKYEWERQLKKGISGLPKAEQQRVLDYYNELFADKIDAGLREQYIISEFGNPYDVANKILVDFYNGDKENPEVDEYIYSTSDDIDVAFDEEEIPQTVETPKRKTWNERREERRVERKDERRERQAEHNERDFDDIADESGKKNKAKKLSHGLKSASGLITLICVFLYCVMGACFNFWHPGWLIFLALPCVITLIEAITRRNWRIFAYPVFATFMFLLIGFKAHRWHPTWILFLTIPIYYVLGDFITKNTNSNKNDSNGKKRDLSNEETQPRKDKREKNRDDVSDDQAQKQTSKKSANVISVIAKALLTACLVLVALAVWWFVIGLFIGGIGMVIGGIALFATSVVVGSSVNLLVMGAAFAVMGLGLICAFGMAAMFKPCVKMCKSFLKTIKNCFETKEAA